jgi:glutamate-1-semialdehyde 2,1-aminomutase
VKREVSERLFSEARELMPGGVSSPVRAFRAVGETPLFVERGEGAYVVDVDGRRYVDLVGSWGALLFGHAHPEILAAATAAAAKGTSFGAPTEGEVELAARLVDALPGLDMVRLVSSGTEATMSAVRLARAATGRNVVLKFDGCYHGHADAFLADGAGSGLATLGIPRSPGVTEGAARDTVTIPYNDREAVRRAFAEVGERLAAVIVEPVAANMGVVAPIPGFLEDLRERSAANGTVLIFDEVITGFRIGYGGAQTRFGITPDLTTLGKVMGGGFPCAAFGGRRDLMERLAPEGPVYQAGTLSGNPVAVAAGIATLDLARRFDPYPQLEGVADGLEKGLHAAFQARDIPAWIGRAGSLLSVFFTDGPVHDFADAKAADHERFARFFHHMLANGVALPPSGYELWTLGTQHGPDEVGAVLGAAASFDG